MGPEKHRGFYTCPSCSSSASTRDDARCARSRESLDGRRRHQHAVHVGHDRLPQGRHAHAPQHPQQRLLHRRAPEASRPTTASACRCRSSTASAACSACSRSLTHGATLVMVESFDPLLVLAAIQKERATALYGVPTMFIAELDAPDVRHVRPDVAAHRHHGRLAVPDRDDEAGHRPDARLRDDDLLRPDRDLAGVHADDDRRHARAQVRDGRPQARRGRGARRRSRDRRGLPAGRAGRAAAAAATTS